MAARNERLMEFIAHSEEENAKRDQDYPHQASP